MQRMGSAAAAAIVLALGAGPAAAQTITVIDCQPRIGIAVGSASNSDRNGPLGAYPKYRSGHSPDVAASAEVPLVDYWSARADVGTAAWTFQDRDLWGAPLTRDRVRVTRATVSMVKQTPTPCGSPLRLYAGAGYGVYHYHFRNQHVRATRTGVHGLIGIEVQPRDRIAFAADFTLHVVRGPRHEPVYSELLTVGQATVGVRFLF
jgi:hypothetical protein